MKSQPIVAALDLGVSFGSHTIFKGLNFAIDKEEIVGIIGGSGCGKTTLLRTILTLIKPTAGHINIFDTDITQCSLGALLAIQRRWGVLFQQNALFSSLNILENVQFPLRTFTHLPVYAQEQIALLKIAMTGLPQSAAVKYPAELSGGMQKRAALARAIALDPELLFLDEPTAGLDAKSTAEFDELILNLRHSLGLTIIMVTHDLDSLARVADKVIFLGEGKVLAMSSFSELIANPHPAIQSYFSSYKK